MVDGAEPPNPADPARSSQPGRAPSSPSIRPSLPPRPSQAPHAARPWRGAWRVVFAFVWVATQIVLVITADRRADAAFGFRMFSESSTLKVALYREVTGADGQPSRVHVDDGVWTAPDAGGTSHRHAWRDRVRRQELAIFDTEINAKYAVDAQLERLQAALDDVAAHVPDDAQTKRFLLDVTVRKNGREPYVVHLASHERPGGS